MEGYKTTLREGETAAGERGWGKRVMRKITRGAASVNSSRDATALTALGFSTQIGACAVTAGGTQWGRNSMCENMKETIGHNTVESVCAVYKFLELHIPIPPGSGSINLPSVTNRVVVYVIETGGVWWDLDVVE